MIISLVKTTLNRIENVVLDEHEKKKVRSKFIRGSLGIAPITENIKVVTQYLSKVSQKLRGR